MEFNINEISASEKEIEITYSFDEIRSDLDKEILASTKKIQLPGFRKGKAPVSMIKKIYGTALDSEAAEKVASTKFYEVSDLNHLHVIGRPVIVDINFKREEDFKFKVKYETLPKLDVQNYTGLEIKVPDFKLQDEDVEYEINNLLKSNSEKVETSEVDESNNFILDVEIIRIDEKGEVYAGSKAEKMQLDLTNERINKDIVQNAKGKKIGDSFQFSFNDERIENANSPEEKKISEYFGYSATINKITKLVMPALSDDFIKRITKGKSSNEAEMRAQIKSDLENEIKRQNDEFYRNALIQQIIKNNEFTPPRTMVSSFLEEIIKEEELNSKKNGYKKFNRQESETRNAKAAEFEVKWYLISSAIKEKEHIEISESELNEHAQKDASETGIDLEKILAYYNSTNFKNRLTDNKLITFLKDNNKTVQLTNENYSGKDVEVVNE